VLYVLIAAIALAETFSPASIVLPIAGRGVGAHGPFSTQITIENRSGREATAELRFLRAAQPNPLPERLTLRIPPHARLTLDRFPENGIGAVLIEANRPVRARAIVAPAGLRVSGVPLDYAIGNDETATVRGTRLHLVEVTGQPLLYIITLYDPHHLRLAEKRRYIAAFEQRTLDLEREFPRASVADALVELHGFHGSGRIVAAGQAGERSLFTMTSRRVPMPLPEKVAYAALALIILAVAIHES
jgi:hypothetical protein